MKRQFTKNDVLRLREETGIGMQEAVRKLCKQQFHEAMRYANHHDDLKEALLFAIDEGLL